MTITGLVVCVNFADLLSKSIDRWMLGANVIVVTSPDDKATIELCRSRGVVYYPTDAFYKDGAMFNKGAAIAEAVDSLKLLDKSDWMLFFDADVLPPEDWRAQTEKSNPYKNAIYGASRCYENGNLIQDKELAGYFMLFSTGHANARRVPIVETCWSNCGNYDTEFQARWKYAWDDMRALLPFILTHFGETSQNWCGRGRPDLMKALFDERRRRGGYEHERIGP